MKAAALLMSVLGLLAGLSLGTAAAGGPDLPTVLASDDGVGRLRDLEAYLQGLPKEEVPAALRQAIAGHGPGRGDAIDALSGRWVELDAPAALAFARQTSDGKAGESIEDAVYGDWADRDPDGALEAANKADAGERATAIWQIAHKVGSGDPQRASVLIASVHAVKMQDSDYFIFWNWAEKDLPQATEALLQKAKVAGFSYPCEAAVWAITDRLLDGDPKAATKWMEQLPPGELRDEAFERLVSEWKDVDSVAVAAWLKSLPETDQTRNAILNVPPKRDESASPRLGVDPAFAAKADQLDKILRDSNVWHELEALMPLVDGLSPAEFPQALAHLCNTPDSNRDTVTDVLVARWSKVDPDGAVKAIPMAAAIHDREFFDRFLEDIYAAWARRDPEAALAAATRDDHGVGDCDVLRVILAAMAHRDAVRAYQAFQKLKDANSHMLVVPIFTEWAGQDLSAATKALPDEPHSDGAIEGIVIGLMRGGPAEAIAWATHLPEKADRDRALRDVALRWPDDPEAAAAWLEKGPDFDGKDGAFDDVAVDWAIRDTMGALRHAAALAEGKEKDSLLHWGLAQLTYNDANAALSFARQLSDPDVRKHAVSTVMDVWGEYDPAAAANFLSSIATEATPGDVAGIAWSMSDGDPVSAVRWLDALPASVDRAPAIGAIAKNWYRTDPAAAEAWVKQKPAGPLYDAGAQGICEALNGKLPLALEWARSIHDPKIRHDEVHHVFDAAAYHVCKFVGDPGEITDEIRSAPEFTDAERTALIAKLPHLEIFREPQPSKLPLRPTSQ